MIKDPKTMWAATTLSCRVWPPVTTTGSQGHFIVSARYSRPRKNINYYPEDEEDEEKEEIDTWKPQEIGDSDDVSSSAAKISGSVVLLALQKASSQKTSKQMTKKMKKKKKKKEVDDKGDAITDYSGVKPLCVKSDWKDKLDELETQLHQLIHNA
ncbi:uncharacterized protein LOC111912396 [Lactuca sativa]|uniref:Uncharacterized protein n=1 Tax=Lactuca sativa TaxID=4236 RepID=A0A9R1XF00_LACSA|nr:uncharacterized protein LOC111912396 [Lactuca sativa]KAJ0210084.1 hypothetical protein LSAT_V11C400215030 [Lactuca sativa]